MCAARGEGEGGEDKKDALLAPGLHLPVTADLRGEECRIVGRLHYSEAR